MKKIVLFLVIVTGVLGLVACSDDGMDTESTIVDMKIVDGEYFFDVVYELEGFYEPLTATIKVTQTVFESHSIGDTYIFKRPEYSRTK